MIILYSKVLTKEESIASQARQLDVANYWWNSLSIEEKILTHKALALVYKQRKCQHNFTERMLYDDPYEYCSECDYKKLVD